MRPRELEEAIGNRLRQLPAPRAPETLLPRVRAAVQAWAQRPWYARAWFTWPAPLQIGSLAVFTLLAALASLAWPEARATAFALVAKPSAPLVAGASGAWQAAGTVLQIVRVLWRAVIEPLVPFLFVWVAAMCAACVAFLTAIGRVASAGHIHR